MIPQLLPLMVNDQESTLQVHPLILREFPHPHPTQRMYVLVYTQVPLQHGKVV